MVVAQQVQDAVDDEQVQLLCGGVALLAGLGIGARVGDDDVAQVAAGPRRGDKGSVSPLGGKGEHVGGRVHLQKVTVQGLNALVVGENQGQLARAPFVAQHGPGRSPQALLRNQIHKRRCHLHLDLDLNLNLIPHTTTSRPSAPVTLTGSGYFTRG